MEKEIESYLNKVRAELSSAIAPSCVLPSCTMKDPKPESELEGYIHRGSTWANAKMR